ncbi:MAG: hypothetical protein Q8861_08515 [Bacteroidota bacterium]|nr:hypothetical protein [Bacteroidota bacterium]
MKNLIKLVVGCILSVSLSSCFVTGTVSDDYGEAYVNYYPYYFCPDMNFYFNPDLNIYWWYQEGVWRSGAQLPYWYHVGYNTNYVIVSVYDRNPTRYYSQHMRAYRRGDYSSSVYHFNDRPSQSLRSYRPDRAPSGYRSGGSRNDDLYNSRRNPNYDNRGTRSNSTPQTNGSRSSGNQQWNSNQRDQNTRPDGTYNRPTQNPGQGNGGSVSPSNNNNTRPQGGTQNQLNNGNSNQNSQGTRPDGTYNRPTQNPGQGNSGTVNPSNNYNTRPQGETQNRWNSGNTNQNTQGTRPENTYSRPVQTNTGDAGQGSRWQQSGSGNQNTRQPATVAPQNQQTQPSNNGQRQPQTRESRQPSRQEGSRFHSSDRNTSQPAPRQEAPKKTEDTPSK